MNTEAPGFKILELRALLAQKFPAPALPVAPKLPTHLPVLDESLQGGLWKGGLVELVCEGASAGSASLLAWLLEQSAQAGRWAALIDGRDSFDPQSLPAATLSRLLWIRCHTAEEALQSADLLLRDGNLPLVCLDLLMNRPAELRRLSGPAWYRLQRVIEPTAVALLALTPFPLIPCAEVRLRLEGQFTIKSLEEEPQRVRSRLKVKVTRRRQMEHEEGGGLRAIA